MVKRILAVLVLIPVFSFSQELPGLDSKTKYQTPNYFQPNLLKTSATISPGRMLHNRANSIYLSGFLEYLLDKNYSLRGDVFQFIDAQYTSQSLIEPYFQNRLFFGVFKHFGRLDFKFYSGIQMGTTITTYNQSFLNGNKTRVEPSFSLKAGATYYIWKYFHFFADVTYLNSTLRGTSFGSQIMDEVIFSAGLGFQIKVKKKMKQINKKSIPAFK
jgi:hypothetical protein